MARATGIRSQSRFTFNLVLSLATVATVAVAGALSGSIPAFFLLNQKAVSSASMEALIATQPPAAAGLMTASAVAGCSNCGVIESVRVMTTADGESGLAQSRKHGAYHLTVRMNDGSVRTVYHSLPGFRTHTRVWLRNL